MKIMYEIPKNTKKIKQKRLQNSCKMKKKASIESLDFE